MPITIGSNIASLITQRRLGDASAATEKSFERLSSGMRINRASDDAAGLAVSQSLNAQARIFSRSILNVNDHLSALQIATGAAEQISGALTRMIELSEQASNGTYGSSQRLALQREANALKDEINRIIDSTTFQGRKLLDGTYTNSRVQIGDTTSNLFADIASITNTLRPDGSFAGVRSFGAGPSDANRVASGDFNGDGILDVANVSGTLSGGLIVSFGNGDGSFRAGVTLGTGGSGIFAADIDNDGDTDILSNTFSAGEIFVSINNGNGTFLAQRTYASGITDGNRLQVGDLNGDGRVDIAMGSQTATGVRILLGNGNGTFQAALTINTGYSLRSLDLGDIDGDGDLDMVGIHAGGVVTRLINNGSGSFSGETTYASGSTGRELELVDINGDGRLDYVAADASGLLVGINAGNGLFNSAINIQGGNFQATSITDVNDDGILDIVGAGSNFFQVMLGRGDGTFRAGSSTATLSSVEDITVEDFDKDGLKEVVTAGGTAAGPLGYHEALGIAGVAGVDFSTQQLARDALDRLRRTLENTALNVGSIGATEARLNTVKNILAITRENYLSAKSRIEDVDVAEETAQLVRNQILQQAGAAILAQANQAPLLALQLLRGK